MFCLYVWAIFPLKKKPTQDWANLQESTAESCSDANTFEHLIPASLKPNLPLDVSTMGTTNAFLLKLI